MSEAKTSAQETGVQVKIEMNEVSSLVGKLLTIIEAVFPDENQQLAVKSLVKRTVWEWGREWHFAATEEQLQALCGSSEEIETPLEPQVPHLED